LGNAEDRKHWVGGSLIRVVDGETGKVMGQVRAFSFALPPRGVLAADLDKRTWADRMSCPKYLDIQSAMTRISLIGIVDPKRDSVAGTTRPETAKLEEAVAKGVLRAATWADVDAWNAAAGKSKAVRSGEPFRTYVVLKAFELPPGLHGAHSAQFYVPKGAPRPTGDPGHSSIHDFNTMRCEGPDCRRR